MVLLLLLSDHKILLVSLGSSNINSRKRRLSQSSGAVIFIYSSSGSLDPHVQIKVIEFTYSISSSIISAQIEFSIEIVQ